METNTLNILSDAISDVGSRRWWACWRDYCRLRKTKDAYAKDWACEITIPADVNHPTGNWPEETL